MSYGSSALSCLCRKEGQKMSEVRCMKTEERKQKYSYSTELRNAIMALEYKAQYKACEVFYQILQEEDSCDDSVMCGRFRESFEMIEPSLPESSFVPLHWAVNDMDNAIYEIDIYEPGLFIRIARKLGDVISEYE